MIRKYLQYSLSIEEYHDMMVRTMYIGKSESGRLQIAVRETSGASRAGNDQDHFYWIEMR